MKSMLGSALLTLTLLQGCATQSVPVAVACPPRPPVPQVLTESASTPPSLVQRYEALTKAFSESLKAAQLP